MTPIKSNNCTDKIKRRIRNDSVSDRRNEMGNEHLSYNDNEKLPEIKFVESKT